MSKGARAFLLVLSAFWLAGCEVNYQPGCTNDCTQGDLGDMDLGEWVP